MNYYSSEQLIENLYEEICNERDRNENLSMRNDSLEEEISYLRPMVKYLIEHLSVKMTLDELSTTEKIRDDLAYFEEKNYDIEDACVYGPKDHKGYSIERMW
jgi:hypothetical protein